MAVPVFPHKDLLATAMPDDAARDFLDACLIPGSPHRRALAAPGRLEDILRQRPAARRLLPLLSAGFAQDAVATGARTASLLRTAVLWERTRLDRINAILAEVRQALEGAGIAGIVTGGLACNALAYEPDAPRHCHDIDIAVDPHRRDAAREALRAAGYAPAADSHSVMHRDGLAITLHGRENASQVSSGASHGALPFPTFDVADTLALRLWHAALSGMPQDWSWAADAAMLIRAADDREALENRINELAIGMGAALAIGHRLTWLKTAGLAPVSDAVLAKLQQRASTESRATQRPFLSAACRASGLSGRQLLKRCGLASSLVIVSWAASRRLEGRAS